MPEVRRAGVVALLLLVLLIPQPGAAAPAPSRATPRVLRSVLDNGLTVIVEEHAASDIVALYTWVRVGSKDEDEETNGVAHFIEHMLFKGTAKRKPGVMEREVEGLGGVLNAATSVDYTNYFIIAAAKHFDQMLELQADAVTNPIFDAAEMERERRVVIEEINSRWNSPATRAFDAILGVAFTTHPYRRTILGPRAGLERMSRETLVNFYQTHYVPSKMSVVVVGNIRADDVLNKVRRAYTGFQLRGAPRPARPVEPPISGVRRLVIEQDVRVAYVAMGFHAPAAHDRDVYATDVLEYVLGGGLGARLRQQIVDRTRLAQSAGAAYLVTEDPSLFIISAVADPSQVERTEAAILTELASVREQGISETELVRAKNLLEGEHVFRTHTARGRARYLGLSATVVGLEFGQTYVERIRQVTRDDVQRAARRLFDPQRYAIVVIRSGGAQQ